MLLQLQVHTNLSSAPDDPSTIIGTTICAQSVQATKPFISTGTATEHKAFVDRGMCHDILGGWPANVDPKDAEQVMRWKKKVERDDDYIKTVARLGGVVEELVNQNNAFDVYTDWFSNNSNCSAGDGNLDNKNGYQEKMESATEVSGEFFMTGRPALATITVLRQPAAPSSSSPTQHGVQALAWHPDSSSTAGLRLAAAHGSSSSAVSSGAASFVSVPSYIWNVNSHSSSCDVPELVLLPAGSLTSLAFSLRDHSILAGGQQDGRLALFDIRKGGVPTLLTNESINTNGSGGGGGSGGEGQSTHCHHGQISDVRWMQSKTGTELMTCGADGKILWWDTRQMAVPLDSMLLYATNTKTTTTAAGEGTHHHLKAGNDGGESSSSSGNANTSNNSPTLLTMSGLCFDYSPQAGPAKFLVGTGQGVVLAGNRKAKTKAEAITARYPGHHGAIVSVCRNPFLPKYFLTIGDWTAKVWAEDAKHALVSTPYQTSQLTAGCWSSSKPGVFWAGSNDGCVQVWDLLQNRKEAQVVARVADAAVTAMSINGGGGGASSLSSNPSSSAAQGTPRGGRQLAAVGCSDGSISLLRPSGSLLYELSDEKSGLVSALEREGAREKGLEKLSRDAKVRARKVQADGGKKKENRRSLEAVSKYDLAELERQFYVQFGVKIS